jgi:hypothetical protein
MGGAGDSRDLLSANRFKVSPAIAPNGDCPSTAVKLPEGSEVAASNCLRTQQGWWPAPISILLILSSFLIDAPVNSGPPISIAMIDKI